MYKRQRIKALHAQGVSIREIARTLGVPRNTVRKYLKEANSPQFKAREYEKQLDRYREEIQAMLDKGYIGTRIHKELAQKGYNGSLSSIHRFLLSGWEKRGIPTVKNDYSLFGFTDFCKL